MNTNAAALLIALFGSCLMGPQPASAQAEKSKLQSPTTRTQRASPLPTEKETFAQKPTPVESAAPNSAESTTIRPSPEIPPVPPPITKEPAPPASTYIGVHAQVGFPRPSGLGMNLMALDEALTLELIGSSSSFGGYGFKVGLSSFELGARYHIFRGSFFVGAGFGQQILFGEYTEFIQNEKATIRADVKTIYFTPQLGWMAGKSEGGFFFETQLGYQIPMSTSVGLSTDAAGTVATDPAYLEFDRRTREDGALLGRMAVPVVSFKLGYLF